MNSTGTVTISVNEYDSLRDEIKKLKEILKKKSSFKIEKGNTGYGYEESFFLMNTDESYGFVKMYIEDLQNTIKNLEKRLAEPKK